MGDVPQSYETVPLGAFLSQLGYTSEEPSEEYSDKKTYGISVFLRIAEQKESELGILVQLFSGNVLLPAVENDLSASVAEEDRGVLLAAVKQAVAKKQTLVR